MKTIVCVGALALLALVGCESSSKKDSNMSVMSEKSGGCCSEKKDGASCDKSAEKSNMSVISEKKSCSGGEGKTCPVTGAKQ